MNKASWTCGTVSESNICGTEVPEEKVQKSILKIMAENFSNFVKVMSLQIQKAQ